VVTPALRARALLAATLGLAGAGCELIVGIHDRPPTPDGSGSDVSIGGGGRLGGTGGAALSGSGGAGGGRLGSGGAAAGSGGAGSGGRGSGGANAGSGGGSGSGGANAGSGGAASGGAGGAGALLFFEDFESGAASRWTPMPPSDWTVVVNGTYVYRQGNTNADTSWRISAAGDPAWSDVVVEARVRWLPPSTLTDVSFAAVGARFQDGPNFYWAGLGTANSSGTTYVFIRRRTGEQSVFLGMAPAPVTRDTWYALKLRAVGSTLTAFLNDVQMLEVQDTTFTTGRVVVATFKSAAEFDDVRVTVP
jgi:hypothetical protein